MGGVEFGLGECLARDLAIAWLLGDDEPTLLDNLDQCLSPQINCYFLVLPPPLPPHHHHSHAQISSSG
jgi:hypothetical protein